MTIRIFSLTSLIVCASLTIAPPTSAQDKTRKLDIEKAIKETAPKRTPQPPVKIRPSKSLNTKRITPKNANSPTRDKDTGEAPPEFETGVEFKPVSPRTKVTFNLEDADLPDLVRLISNMTGKRFILPGKIRSIKATVFAPTKVTAGEAYNAFLSILDLNGLTVVPAGRYLKIVETGGVETQPLPTYADGTKVPRSDRYITRLHHLENVSAEDVSALLSRFKSREGNITAYAPTNMLIMTDTGTQIRRMLRLIGSIDVSKTGTQTWIEPVHFANAAELATRLQEIFPTGGGAAGTPPTSSSSRPNRTPPASSAKSSAQTATIGASGESSIHNIIADERTNSLIIIATERAYLRVLEMIRQLDVALEGEGRVHVHYVQHSDAEDIANALNQLIGGAATPRRPGAGRNVAANQAASAGSGGLFEGDIRVTSYEPSNALVITSSLHDYMAIKRVVERLDAPRRQVFIEAVIMELSLSRSSQLGLSYHAGVPDFPTTDSLSVFGFEAAGSVNPFSETALTGLALGVRGPTIENSQQLVGFSVPGFGVAIQALAESGDTNVISTPHIIAMDNVEAEITVGANIPLQTSGISLGGGGGQLAALAALGGQGGQGATGLGALSGLGGGQVQRQDIGTTIRIVPHINENNEVRLEIEEEISEAGVAQGTLGVIPINRRAAKTEVMVRDQQTIVIGGLMRDRVQTSETKIPVLGDLPILGALFRKTSKTKEKTNLVLFLTPYIIRDPSDLRSIYERKMHERQEFLDRHFVFSNNDYETPIDYSRTRGLVTEIINEIDDIDEEQKALDEASAKPTPDHAPRNPVGSYVAEKSDPDSVVMTPDGETTLEADEQRLNPPAVEPSAPFETTPPEASPPAADTKPEDAPGPQGGE